MLTGVIAHMDWNALSNNERLHLMNNWVMEENKCLSKLTDRDSLCILEQFNTFQLTKTSPCKYRTIVEANKNVAIADTMIESVCLAALKAKGLID